MPKNILIAVAAVIVLLLAAYFLVSKGYFASKDHIVSEPYHADAVSSSRLLQQFSLTQPSGNKQIRLGELKFWAQTPDGELRDVSPYAKASFKGNR